MYTEGYICVRYLKLARCSIIIYIRPMSNLHIDLYSCFKLAKHIVYRGKIILLEISIRLSDLPKYTIYW